MKKILIILLVLLQVGLYAKLFKYTDSRGVHYVDSLSKVPKRSKDRVRGVSTKFLKTGIKDIDRFRKIISSKGVYYKELQNQKLALIAWATLMVNANFKYLMNELSAIESIDTKVKKRYKRRKLAKKLARYFNILENEWPRVYKKINFKTSGDKEIDDLRENYKKVRTTSQNISQRISLVEKWSVKFNKHPKADMKKVKKRLKGLNELFDTPKPDMEKLIKYLDKTISIFEKEFNK